MGQEPGNAIAPLDLSKDITTQLPTLDSLIQMAVAYHPTIKLNQELEGVAEQRIQLAKRSWANLLRGYADYSHGNQSIITSGSQATDVSNFANGYRTGINFSLPLSEIYNRKGRIRLQERELNAASYKTQEMELVVANLVIEEYNNMVTGQQLMNVQFEMREKARTNLQLAELDYKSGNMEGAVYIRNAEIFSIAQMDYENAKKEFVIAAQKLEILIGAPLSQISKSR
jgi:outer membrane protein TolC